MKEKLAAKITSQVLRAGAEAPDRVILMLLGMVGRAIHTSGYQKAIRHIRQLMREGHASVGAVRRLAKELSGRAREALVRNVVIEHFLSGYKKRLGFKQKHGYASPPFMLISPTMRCNLRCRGCWASDYEREPELDEATFERIISECQEIGTTVITITGGEPFIIWDQIRTVSARHPRLIFQIFTNGTLIDETVADDLMKLPHVYPVFSVEGNEAATDERRGRGVYAAVTRAMRLLKERGLLFAFSATTYRQNFDSVLSDVFVETMIERGCLYGYYFSYMPIGMNPDLSMLLTPEQRVEATRRTVELRRRHPILLADVWHEIEYFEGCVAGGRKYFHINNKGDIEVCVFAHFAADNIYDTTITEALGSRFFRATRHTIDGGKEVGCRCLILEKNRELAALTSLPGVYPTHPGADLVVKDLGDQFSADADTVNRLRAGSP